MTPKTYLTVAAALAISLPGCSDDDDNGPSARDEAMAKAGEMSQTYANIVVASYEDSLELAIELDDALEALVDSPSAGNLTTAKDLWLDAREPYLETEVYRFYDGPIDNPENGPEGLLNAWPLDENYIDYTTDLPDAGIINDTDQEITGVALEDLNGIGAEENVATGYHAIEFLLWGQDLDPNGPGARPFTDYASGEDATADNQDRRGDYLTVAGDLLVDHLTIVLDEWKSDSEVQNYRDEWDALAPEQALNRAMTGMIILSGFETGGERLQAALDSGSQEDEHSCFSDNTHRDMIQDVQGVQNVWLGQYERLDGSTVSGTGVRDVVAELDAGLAAQITAQIDESLSLANALPVPFDQAIDSGNGDGRQAVTDLISSLRDQEDLLEDAFRLFELAVPEAE